jgi:putative oxidoreductase
MQPLVNKLSNWLLSWGALLGRLALALIFLGAAFKKITGFSGTVEYMATKMPGVSDGMLAFLLAGATAFLLLGGVSLVLGMQTRWGALLLLIFLAVVTPIFHGFWAVPEAEMQAQLIQFQKNLALGGAMLMVMAHGPGTLSVDHWCATRKERKTEMECKVCGSQVTVVTPTEA